MIGLCIECSHRRGMGHLFRALNVAWQLRANGREFVFILNEDPVSLAMLQKERVLFHVVDLEDVTSNWEAGLIHEYGIEMWINDRLDTAAAHGRFIKEHCVQLVTFDDRGGGAEYADVHVAALVFSGREKLRGQRVLSGVEYLVLTQQVKQARRQRTALDRLLVTMGGSDTYGVTVQLVEILKSLGLTATVHHGPAFSHRRDVADALVDGFVVADDVASLPALMHDHDLAITGGGITPFEAGASGLPCLTIACEPHEVEVCRFLEGQGIAPYLGRRQNLAADEVADALARIDPAKASLRGMEAIPTDGLQRILEILEVA